MAGTPSPVGEEKGLDLSQYFIGCDPDTHACSFALVDDQDNVIELACCKVPDKLTGLDAVVAMGHALSNFWLQYGHLHSMAYAVEAQEVAYTARQKGANPRSLILVANVAGMALQAGMRSCLEVRPYMPYPSQWKGSVPKQIHQGRILDRLGCDFERVGKDPSTGYCRPTSGTERWAGAEELNKGDWKHVVDAIGLALWAREKYLADTARERALTHT